MCLPFQESIFIKSCCLKKNSSFTFPSINPLSGTNVVAIPNLAEEERNVSTLRVTRFLNFMLYKECNGG